MSYTHDPALAIDAFVLELLHVFEGPNSGVNVVRIMQNPQSAGVYSEEDLLRSTIYQYGCDQFCSPVNTDNNNNNNNNPTF